MTDQSKREHWLDITFVGGSVFYAVYLGNYIGTSMQGGWYLVLALAVILCSVGMYSVLRFMIRHALRPPDPPDGLSDSLCQYTGQVCCGHVSSVVMSQVYRIAPRESLRRKMRADSSIWFQDDLLEAEERDFAGRGGSEIWILSSTLSSELRGGAVRFVSENLGHSITYRYFYANSVDQGETNIFAKRNVAIMRQLYPASENMMFYEYNRAGDEIDGNLLGMFGVVIYIDRTGDQRAYFSMRPQSSEEIPIYIRMPWCMATRYFMILTDIKNLVERSTLNPRQGGEI